MVDQDIFLIVEGIDDIWVIKQLKDFGFSYVQGNVVVFCELFEVWLEGVVFCFV